MVVPFLGAAQLTAAAAPRKRRMVPVDVGVRPRSRGGRSGGGPRSRGRHGGAAPVTSIEQGVRVCSRVIGVLKLPYVRTATGSQMRQDTYIVAARRCRRCGNGGLSTMSALRSLLVRWNVGGTSVPASANEEHQRSYDEGQTDNAAHHAAGDCACMGLAV